MDRVGLAGEQRQRPHPHQGLTRGVGLQRRHSRESGVQGQQQVEAPICADLSHDHPTVAFAGSPSRGRAGGSRRCALEPRLARASRLRPDARSAA